MIDIICTQILSIMTEAKEIDPVDPIIFLASCGAPFIYVILFGKNIPWWVYLIIVIIIGQSVYSLVNRLGKNREIKKDG